MYEELYRLSPCPIEEVANNPSQLLTLALRGLLVNQQDNQLVMALELLSRLGIEREMEVKDGWRTKRSTLHVGNRMVNSRNGEFKE